MAAPPPAAPAPDRLVVDGLSQRFGDRLVLDDVGFEVLPGRVTGLLGPNGAGKTTLMRILFGVIEPDAGSVTWRGRPVAREDRVMWGYMPQERGLYTEMRVLDHLVRLAQAIVRTGRRLKLTEVLRPGRR